MKVLLVLMLVAMLICIISYMMMLNKAIEIQHRTHKGYSKRISMINKHLEDSEQEIGDINYQFSQIKRELNEMKIRAEYYQSQCSELKDDLNKLIDIISLVCADKDVFTNNVDLLEREDFNYEKAQDPS